MSNEYSLLWVRGRKKNTEANKLSVDEKGGLYHGIFSKTEQSNELMYSTVQMPRASVKCSEVCFKNGTLLYKDFYSILTKAL